MSHPEHTTRELVAWSYPREADRGVRRIDWLRRIARRYADRVGYRYPGGIVWRRRDKDMGL